MLEQEFSWNYLDVNKSHLCLVLIFPLVSSKMCGRNSGVAECRLVVAECRLVVANV
jgi:hypothetical protein